MIMHYLCIAIIKIPLAIKTQVNNQRTINPKDRKNAFSGIPTRVHHRLPGLTLYPCRHLVSYPCILQSGDTRKCVSPGRRWWTRVGIPEKAVFPSLGFIVRWLLACVFIANIIHSPEPVRSGRCTGLHYFANKNTCGWVTLHETNVASGRYNA